MSPAPCSLYSSRLIHICWKVPSEARMEPPIHTLCRRSTVLAGLTTCAMSGGGGGTGGESSVSGCGVYRGGAEGGEEGGEIVHLQSCTHTLGPARARKDKGHSGNTLPTPTLTLAMAGAISATSRSSLSRMVLKMAVPPVSTTPLYSSRRTSTSHLRRSGGSRVGIVSQQIGACEGGPCCTALIWRYCM